MSPPTDLVGAFGALYGGAVNRFIESHPLESSAADPDPDPYKPKYDWQELVADKDPSRIRRYNPNALSDSQRQLRDQLEPVFRQTEAKYGLPTGLLEVVAYQESSLGRDRGDLSNPSRAQGLMQIVPGVHGEELQRLGLNHLDDTQAIEFAGRYLGRLHTQFGNIEDALAAYNAGQGNVRRSGGLPNFPETRHYVGEVLPALVEHFAFDVAGPATSDVVDRMRRVMPDVMADREIRADAARVHSGPAPMTTAEHLGVGGTASGVRPARFPAEITMGEVSDRAPNIDFGSGRLGRAEVVADILRGSAFIADTLQPILNVSPNFEVMSHEDRYYNTNVGGYYRRADGTLVINPQHHTQTETVAAHEMAHLAEIKRTTDTSALRSLRNDMALQFHKYLRSAPTEVLEAFPHPRRELFPYAFQSATEILRQANSLESQADFDSLLSAAEARHPGTSWLLNHIKNEGNLTGIPFEIKIPYQDNDPGPLARFLQRFRGGAVAGGDVSSGLTREEQERGLPFIERQPILADALQAREQEQRVPRIGGRRIPLPFASTLSPEGRRAWSAMLNGDTDLDNAIRSGTSVSLGLFESVRGFIRENVPEGLVNATDQLVAHVDEFGPFIMLGGVTPLSWRKVLAMQRRSQQAPVNLLENSTIQSSSSDQVSYAHRRYQTPNGIARLSTRYDARTGQLEIETFFGPKSYQRMDLGDPGVMKIISDALMDFPQATTLKYHRISGVRGKKFRDIMEELDRVNDQRRALGGRNANTREYQALQRRERELHDQLDKAQSNKTVIRDLIP